MKKILVVEDDPKLIIFLQDQLEYLGFEVLVARDGHEGIETAKKTIPDLVILDVMMPKMDGYEVCRLLKSSQTTQTIPILMLTAKGQLQDRIRGFDVGADDYLPKPYDQAELQARIAALLRRSTHNIYGLSTTPCSFSISCKSEHRINIRLNGPISLNVTTKRPLEMMPEVYSRYAQNVSQNDWRFTTKQIGMQLFNSIFTEHSEILGAYQQTLGAVGQHDGVHLIFESSRDYLRIPFEFLYDHLYENGDFLVLRHPLVRSINGIGTKKRSLEQNFFNNLYTSRESLKILFIASNAPTNIPEVDREIELLDTIVKTSFEKMDISVESRTIYSSQATYENVQRELNACKYHILHYAGHGNHIQDFPENSHLSFWEKANFQGHIKNMSIAELQMLLRNSSLKFVYLSCCLGGATGHSKQLIEHDFLGIADGLIHAGIPSVLSYRWPVFDNSAKSLAQTFYTALAKYGELGTALLEARCEFAAQNRDDITWLSPILIKQT